MTPEDLQTCAIPDELFAPQRLPTPMQKIVIQPQLPSSSPGTFDENESSTATTSGGRGNARRGRNRGHGRGRGGAAFIGGVERSDASGDVTTVPRRVNEERGRGRGRGRGAPRSALQQELAKKDRGTAFFSNYGFFPKFIRLNDILYRNTRDESQTGGRGG